MELQRNQNPEVGLQKEIMQVDWLKLLMILSNKSWKLIRLSINTTPREGWEKEEISTRKQLVTSRELSQKHQLEQYWFSVR